ncbi:hypothetical protein SO802_008804 [Lithocarpus litseifolius]|uniref:Delta(3)-Delta(2)-enoyl-CoA isomerase n=1 Tax=Lithocarpus litseifolius TaxID=425828 RepID=A0AAW2DA84_9ROSI
MCTSEKRGSLFILTLIGDDHEHRLSPHLIDSLLSALSQVNSQSINGGSALITVARGKFFYNGFDLPWAQSAGTSAARPKRLHQMAQSFRSVVAALISLPIPTVAAVSGHAAAAELILALGHDYILMRRDRGFLYMSEVDLAITLPDYFSALVRSKVGGSGSGSGSNSARRDVLLRGMKVKGEEAVRMGIVDSEAHDSEESVVEAAVRLGDRLAERKWIGEETSLIPLLLFTLNVLIGCRDIMVDAQCGEVLYIPGVMTPTEVCPVSALGSSWYISTLKRPFHHISMVASQGITIDSVREYVTQGASVVVLFDAIFDKEAISQNNFNEIFRPVHFAGQ